MATLNGIKITSAFMNGNEDSQYVEIHLENGAIYASEREFNMTEAEIETADAKLAFEFSREDKVCNPDNWFHVRNIYGTQAWSLNDEISLMDDEEIANCGWAA